MQTFFSAVGVDDSMRAIRKLSQQTGIPYAHLVHYHNEHVLPTEFDCQKLEQALLIDRLTLSLKMGIIDHQVKHWLAANAEQVKTLMGPSNVQKKKQPIRVAYQTELGRLYQEDCLTVLPTLESESVDLIFADPPFNLNKNYGDQICDNKLALEYEHWCNQWLDECIRLLAPGGSLFLWHIPKWSQKLSGFISQKLHFCHWIAVKMNYGLPISGRLYPSHYALLYFTKGPKPGVFKPDRIQIDTCRKCGHELRDYGGHRNKLNPYGLTLQDVWLDIHPVKHRKNRNNNELSLALLDRVIEMASVPGNTVLDPFGGAGVSYIVSELKERRWIGCEIGDIDPIRDRFKNLKTEREELASLREKVNCLFSSEVKKIRTQNNFWTGIPSKVKMV